MAEAARPSRVLAGALLLALCLPSPGRAGGLYVLGELGARMLANQDYSDFFALGTQPGPDFSPSFDGDGMLIAGYRFADPFAVELSAGGQVGRDESALYPFGYLDVQVSSPGPLTFAIAPVFCFDTNGGPAARWLHQVGLRLELAQIWGVESIQSNTDGTGTVDFSGTALGWGVFYRLTNLWDPSSVNVGAELGYESLRFNALRVGSASGILAGQQGGAWMNLNGVQAFMDDSGPTLRLVVGWSSQKR